MGNKILFIGLLLFVYGFLCVGRVYAQTPDTVKAGVSADSLKGIKFYFVKGYSLTGRNDRNRRSGLYYLRSSQDRVLTRWDSAGTYRQERELYGIQSGIPVVLSQQDYLLEKRREQITANWERLLEEGRREQQSTRGLLDFKLNIPGGENSAFTTIFGKPEVNLRVNGTANMNIGASIQKLDDPSIPPDQQSRVDPTFDQNLQLNIQGTIGDKLTISTDWDTERAFDFQNRLSIVYQGYEDEIIKRIELGNVSMETGNSLIRGGGALFGIKSIAEVGPLRLTTVLSQQRGEGNTQSITGGSQEQSFLLRPASYDHDKHFFIDFFNWQEFENNMSNPQQIGQAFQISEFELYIRKGDNSIPDDNAILAVSLSDFGVVRNPDSTFQRPNNALDRFSDELLNNFRDPTIAVTSSDLGVSDQEFDAGLYERLIEGVDYTLNRGPGYISLKRNLNPNDVLAIAYTYDEGGTRIPVGELQQVGQDRIFLKMIRLNNARSNNPTFPLTMRNIYSLGVTGITPEGLELDIEFTQGNIAQNVLPNRNTTLLQDLGLDRVDNQGATIPDNRLDFIGSILDAANGRIIFPFLEPFGSKLEELLVEAGVPASERNQIVYTELYDQNLSQAQSETRPENNFYRITGKSKGGVSSTFFLGVASVVEGSVKVFANGAELVRGADYEVDFSFGTVTILNERYLAPGQEVRIEFESNQFSIVGEKNFTGVRAEYEVNKDVKFGSTFFRLKERPLTDKIRVGSEPINNSVIGFDAKAKFDAPWLTKLIDQVPLLQTKESSSISFTGEFAQLRPDVAQTNAVSDAISRGDLFDDEENGLVFVDDFEGSEVNISFMSPTRWNLASAPVAIPGLDPAFFESTSISPAIPDQSLAARAVRNDMRAQFSWYSIPRNISNIVGSSVTPESQTIRIQDVFPGRETNNPQDQVLTTLDLFYNPTERGPYNYNKRLRELLENESETTWGGMTTVIPSGQEDLTQNNIEFLEFWVQSILPDGREPTGQDILDYNGKIYIDMGFVSEDVVPNSRLNSEDGLATDLNSLLPDRFDQEPRSFIPSNPPPPLRQFSNQNRGLEDVGFDGMPNTNGFNGIDERTQFAEFLDSMRVQYGEGSDEFQRILNDPSNDDYVYFGQSIVSNLPLHERFHRMLGYHEDNSPVAGGDKRAVTNRPDTEGLRTASILEQTNAYFQYEIDFNPADFDRLRIGEPGTFIVDAVPGSRQENRWFQVRVPLTQFKRIVGNISDFQNIAYIRMWMSGYKQPFTMRFATFEFVGSQWRKEENLTENQNSVADFQVSSVNIEENGNRQPFPYRQPIGSIRAVNRGSQLQSLANEQSLVLAVENLGPGEIQMVKRVYPGGLNLINYGNMRMFVHGEGYSKREDLELVVRLGLDLENNYYEYRQFVTPSNLDFPFGPFDPNESGRMETESLEVWLNEENSMNILLSALNQLKQLRNQLEISESELFERADLLRDAPPGARIAIKGNPSLDRIAEIGIGIRNPFDLNSDTPVGVPSLNGQIWVNELRLSDFDNESGWAANAKTSIKLADFANVNANFSRQTNDFGSLDSRLGQRRLSDETGVDFNSTVNLHKLIPDRFGWNIPVSFSVRQSTSTPKFLPNAGDIRLTDFRSAVSAREDLTAEEKSELIDQTINDIQTVSEGYSLNFSNISKRNSKSKLAQLTLDNTTISHVYNTTSGRNPEFEFQDNWNYNSNIRYNLNFRNVKLIRPFKFTGGIPVAKNLSGLRLGFMPSSITASTGLVRTANERRRRPRLDNDGVFQPQAVQQTHTFTHNTNFGLSYNLTPSIQTTFQSNASFDLSQAGIQSLNKTGIDSAEFKILSTPEVIRGVLFDSLQARRSVYREGYTAAWRPRLSAIKQLDWLTYSASYGGGFQWTNSPRGSDLGATVSNNFRLDHTVRLDMSRLLNKVGLYKNAVEADRNESRARAARKNAARRNQTANNQAGNSNNSSSSAGKEVKYIGRKVLLGIFSMKAFDVSYRTNKTSSQAGFAGESQFFKMFGSSGDDFTVPFGYRLGLTESIDKNNLIDNINGTSVIQLPANNTFSDNLTWNTKLTPFTNFTIDLDWIARWDRRRTETISINPINDLQSVTAESGNISSSVWAFGKGYRKLFESQLQTAFDDFDGTNSLSDETGNKDGRTILNRNTVQDDFRKAYVGGGGVIGSKSFMPIPQPNWRVNWAGLEKLIPGVGGAMQRASITHAYSGSFRLGWTFNNIQGEQAPRSIGSFSVVDVRQEFEPTSVNVEQKFIPMVQFNVTWTSGLRTQIGYEQSKITSLAVSSNTITERVSKGFKLSLNYTLRNIALFTTTKSNLDIALNGGFAEDTEEKFLLAQDVNNALTGNPANIPDDPAQFEINPRPETGQNRITGSAILSYRFSSTITSNFEYSFTKVNPKSTRTFARTNHEIKFNFRIAIRSN